MSINITLWNLEQARKHLKAFNLERADVEVHTITIVMHDGSPVLTITGTDDDLQDVTIEERL